MNGRLLILHRLHLDMYTMPAITTASLNSFSIRIEKEKIEPRLSALSHCSVSMCHTARKTIWSITSKFKVQDGVESHLCNRKVDIHCSSETE